MILVTGGAGFIGSNFVLEYATLHSWLYVSDHCDAIRVVLARGHVGETYNIGGNAEMTNRVT